MKRRVLMMVFVALLGLLMVSPAVFAYPMIGENVKFGNGPGDTAGGEFYMSTFVGGAVYDNTFCVEGNEFLNFSDPFTVNAYETPSDGAAYLYYHFVIGDLAGYNYGAGRATSADALQRAIWAFQGQSGGSTSNAFYIAASTAAPAAIAEALQHVVILDMRWASGASAQDVLGYTAVPEPTTLLLLGLGLVGVAGLRRKFF